MGAVSTGFAQGLYSDEEMDSKAIADKQSKIDFLNKIITLTGICLGENLDIRAGKVVAGLEPENTNGWLQAMGRIAADPDLDHEEAVRRAAGGEEPGARPPPRKGGEAEAKSPERPAAAPAAQSKSLDDDEPAAPEAKGFDFAGGSSDAAFADEARSASGAPGTRGGTRAGRGDDKRQTSDAGLGDVPASSGSPAKEGSGGLDAEIEACNSDTARTREMMEKIVTKPKCSDKLLGKPPFRFLHDVISAVINNTGFAKDLYTEEQMNSANVKDKASKIEYLEAIIKRVGGHLNTLVDARPAKIVAGLEAENTCRFLQLLALAALNIDGNSEEKAAAPSAADDKDEPPQPAAPKHESPERPAPAAAKEPSPAKAAAPEPEAKAEPVPADAEPKQKSMRPTTARRRPPKVKENAAAVVKDSAGGRDPKGAQKPAGIMKEGEVDDDDFFNDDDDDGGGADAPLGEAKRVDAADIGSGNRSKLVQNIVAEQEEAKRASGEEEKADDGKKGIKLSLNLKKSAGASIGGGLSAGDMERLTSAVQRLVQSTAPLGKCMDYVVEDLSQMTKEGEKWAAEYRAKIDALEDAKRRTSDDLGPLRGELRGIEDEIEEQKDLIRGVQKNIAKNETKIKQLLRAVASN